VKEQVALFLPHLPVFLFRGHEPGKWWRYANNSVFYFTWERLIS